MSTALTSLTPQKLQRLYQREMEALEGGLVFQNVGSGLRIKALWNISRHKLYEAGGFQTMKQFAESTGFSYRHVQLLIQQGDMLASVVFPSDTPDELRFLTAEHVKSFVDAKRQAKLLAASDPLLLESVAVTALVRSDDEVKAIARKIAAQKRQKVKESGAQSEEVEVAMTARARKFIDKWRRKRMTVDLLVLCAFSGDQEMLDEYNGLAWDDQWPILSTARERILAMPKLR
jgi:hypothetical protein